MRVSIKPIREMTNKELKLKQLERNTNYLSEVIEELDMDNPDEELLEQCDWFVSQIYKYWNEFKTEE